MYVRMWLLPGLTGSFLFFFKNKTKQKLGPAHQRNAANMNPHTFFFPLRAACGNFFCLFCFPIFNTLYLNLVMGEKTYKLDTRSLLLQYYFCEKYKKWKKKTWYEKDWPQ